MDRIYIKWDRPLSGRSVGTVVVVVGGGKVMPLLATKLYLLVLDLESAFLDLVSTLLYTIFSCFRLRVR